MNKTAVIYDKWLSSLGGGEVVACNMARILRDEGYQVTFLCGKKVSLDLINIKIGVDLRGIAIHEIWNDEIQLRKEVMGKDLFINTSFMDYSYNYAKKGIYYAHFPTKLYHNFTNLLFTKYLLPLAAKILKPKEFITDINSLVVKDGRSAYVLDKVNKIAFFHFKKDKEYVIEFHILIDYFYKSLLDNLQVKFNNGEVIKRNIKIDYAMNIIHFNMRVRSLANTMYLNISYQDESNIVEKNKIYLLYPKVFFRDVPESIFKVLVEKIDDRLRAGIFANTNHRLNSYDKVLTHSEFVKKWTLRYWKKYAELLYPPVEMLYRKYNLKKWKKEKMICSVGRFFTLGHGKKQEVMIEAFKKLYAQGYTDWRLHLVGGLSSESSSLEFAKRLKHMAFGYPIYLHFNVTRRKVEEIYLKSSIYWHAGGFGEKENENPVRFEHFGISPVEAMSAGCIPILFDGGGLTEIIKIVGLRKDLYLFSSVEQLIDKTIIHINKQYRIGWKKIFKELNNNFSVEAFRRNFLNLVSTI